MVESLEFRANLIQRFVGAIEGPRNRRDGGILAFWDNHSGYKRVRMRLKQGASKNIFAVNTSGEEGSDYKGSERRALL